MATTTTALRKISTKPTTPRSAKRVRPGIPNYMRVGGRIIDANDISPKALEKIREDYKFLPPQANGYFSRVDLTATCPENHATITRIGLFVTSSPMFTDELLAAITRGKAAVKCATCGKDAKIYGRSLVWAGNIKNWDGVT